MRPGVRSRFWKMVGRSCRRPGFSIRKTADCLELGSGYECQTDICVLAEDSDASASGGQPGVDSGNGTGGTTPCEDGSSDGLPTGDCGGSAGALGITGGCSDQRSAGLDDVSCPGEGGSTPSVLAAACEGAPNALSLVGQRVQSCFADLGTYESSTTTLDEAAVCEPGLRDDVIACFGVAASCPRLPVCLPSGDAFGCVEIRAACPGIGEQHCVNGFDSREHADRLTMAQCISAAPATEDCVDAFYRCAWGI
jgi:hypothetical protein